MGGSTQTRSGRKTATKKKATTCRAIANVGREDTIAILEMQQQSLVQVQQLYGSLSNLDALTPKQVKDALMVLMASQASMMAAVTVLLQDALYMKDKNGGF